MASAFASSGLRRAFVALVVATLLLGSCASRDTNVAVTDGSVSAVPRVTPPVVDPEPALQGEDVEPAPGPTSSPGPGIEPDPSADTNSDGGVATGSPDESAPPDDAVLPPPAPPSEDSAIPEPATVDPPESDEPSDPPEPSDVDANSEPSDPAEPSDVDANSGPSDPAEPSDVDANSEPSDPAEPSDVDANSGPSDSGNPSPPEGSSSDVEAAPPADDAAVSLDEEAEAPPEVPEGGQEISTGPLGSTDVEATTDEGSVAIGDADVPELAGDLPVPDGLEVQLASETAADAGFSGVAPGTVTDIADFYRSGLVQAGFAIVEERVIPEQLPAGTEPSVFLLRFESDDEEGEVVITPAPGQAGSVSVIVTLSQR